MYLEHLKNEWFWFLVALSYVMLFFFLSFVSVSTIILGILSFSLRSSKARNPDMFLETFSYQTDRILTIVIQEVGANC